MPIQLKCDNCTRVIECPRDQVEIGGLMEGTGPSPANAIIVPYPDGWLTNITNSRIYFVCSPDCAADMSKKAGIPFKIAAVDGP